MALGLSLAVAAPTACGPDSAGDVGRKPQPGAGGEARATVERLVRRLGSGSIVEREAAERELVDLGPAVLPLVIPARRNANGASAHALTRIERILELRATDRAVEPALVTLVADETPAGDVLRQLFSQAGSRIMLTANADRRVSLRCDRLTFWEAVDEVLARAGLALEFVAADPSAGGTRDPDDQAQRPEGGMPRLRIVDAVPGTPSPPSVAAGPIRVSVAGVERTGRTASGDDVRNRGARVTLRVAWEPRFEPLLVRLPARSLIAEGPGGEALPAAQRAAVIESTIPPGRPWIDLPLLFAGPAVPLERLGMLRGTIVLWLQGMAHGFCFEGVVADGEPAAGAFPGPLRAGRAEVRLLDVRAAGRRLLIRAAVTYDESSEALASHHSWLAARRLEAFGADGISLEQVDQRIEGRTDRGVSVAAEFEVPPTWRDAGAGQELRIRWTLPIAIHELPIDFALRDVPLPVAPAR